MLRAKAHHQATNSEIAEALTKKGVKISAAYVGPTQRQNTRVRKAERKRLLPILVHGESHPESWAPALPANAITLQQDQGRGPRSARWFRFVLGNCWM